jgi:uncharacterized protein with gpF-like domain
LKFEAAIKWFRKRVPISDDEYATLEEAAKSRAFKVAGIAQLDIVQDVFDQILIALEDGTDFKAFKAALSDRLSAAWGTTGKVTGYKLELAYRNAVQGAYSAGRYAQLTNPDILKARPFWEFDGVADKRQSSICQSADGTILPADHPWWPSHMPQLHHACRSAVRSLTTKAAEKKGITSSPPTVKVSEGFGNVPEIDGWIPDLSGFDSKLLEIHKKK